MRVRILVLAFLAGGVLLLAGPSLAQKPPTLTVYFYRAGQAVPVARAGLLSGNAQVDAETLLRALLAGPSSTERASGLVSALPAGAELAAVTVSGERVTVDLRLPARFLQDELDVYLSDAIVEQVVKTLHPLGLHHVVVRAEHAAAAVTGGRFQPVSDFLSRPVIPAPTPPPNSDAAPEHIGQPPIVGQGQPQGALSGKTVWLSAGHGWYWSETLNRWNTQRGNNYGLVEDFSNAEAVNYYLARYLWNAGADVWLVRERCMNENEVIVDNDAGAPAYTETGAWATSGTPGYQGGTYRYSSTGDPWPATATWTPDLPESGWYAVWAWYREGANRPADVRYEIHHAGGVTTVRVSQEVHGRTWRYLGDYYFEAGSGGHVTLLDQSDEPSQAVIADAVRFGGGLGSIVAPTEVGPGGTSGEPRWEESAPYWAQFQGAPPEVYTSTVTAPPLYAEWESAKGYPGEAENAVYISWHTNAGGGYGTESYIHSTEPTTGSAELQDWVHAELIGDLRGAWNPTWRDRGQKSADFGELRELSLIPGVLLEVAFHDTEDPGDADDLREPLFRQIAARAVFQGIVKYYADRDAAPVHLLPEPPQRLAARSTGPGQVTLTWSPPPCCDGVVGDAATAYKIYQSADGRAFDDGITTTNPSLALTGLPARALRYFRVTALNEGGASFPTPVVAVRTPATGQSPDFFVVDGFDRLDQTALIPQWESPALGTAQRMFLERMNRYDYAVEHAGALAACGLSFDGAVNEAVAAGDVALVGYPAVDWFVGEDAVADESLGDAERALLAAYLDGGGVLLISGAEIGYDLVENSRDPDFYRDYLRAEYLGDDAGTYAFAGVPGGIFAGLAGSLDDSTQGTYDVGYPDRLGVAATDGSTVVAGYVGGAGGGAAVAYAGDYRLVHFGFPLETVTDASTCTALFCAAADYLLLTGTTGAPRLINPGFEGGLGQSAWLVSAPVGAAVFSHRDDLPGYVEPHSGDWLAWLGAYTPGISVTTALTQVVGLPTGEPSVTLTLSWFAHGLGATPSASDTLSVGLYDLNGTLHTESLTTTGESLTDVWRVSEFDLSEFAGETVQLAFRTVASDTAFFVDDVSLLTAGPPAPDEFRALWVDAYHDGIKTPQQIDELVETAQAGSVNALVVQVRRRGDTYYPSAIDPWAPDADDSFDALAYLIERAHAAGIEVHAWATALAIWGGETPPAAPDHTFNLHGPGAAGRDYWLLASYTGEEQPGGSSGLYYLDPGHPDVVDYTVAVYAELAANYDLDGLHLDRIRFPDQKGSYCQGQVWYCQDWGYNPVSVACFQAQTGRSDVPDPLDAQWVQWRRDQVTALQRRVYLTVTALNPQLRVSVATSTSGGPPSASYPWETRTPYIFHLQDWRGWLEEGIVDLALAMTYRDEDTYAAQFDGWVEWEKEHQYGRGTVVGTGLYLNDVADSVAQWQRARRPSELGYWPVGLSGYSYATPSSEGASRRDFVNAVVTEVFTRTASVPGIPWKDAPALGHLVGTLHLESPCLSPVDGHTLTLSGPQSRTLLSDGSGWFGAVGLPPGEYLLSTEVFTTGTTISLPVTISAGAVSELAVVLPYCASFEFFLPLVLKTWP